MAAAEEAKKTVDEAVEDAEKKGAREVAVEEEKTRKVSRERACLSCGTILENGTCPECGVVLENGKQVAKAPSKTPPAEETPPEEQGLFETLEI